MKKYELKSATAEIRKWNQIKEGCTLDDSEPQLIKSFDDKEEALEELKKYETSVRALSDAIGTYYLVEEYYVEENEYDEEGWISGGDVWAFSNLTKDDES